MKRRILSLLLLFEATASFATISVDHTLVVDVSPLNFDQFSESQSTFSKTTGFDQPTGTSRFSRAYSGFRVVDDKFGVVNLSQDFLARQSNQPRFSEVELEWSGFNLASGEFDAERTDDFVRLRTVISYDESIQLSLFSFTTNSPGGFGAVQFSEIYARDLTTGLEIFPKFEFETLARPPIDIAVADDGRGIFFQQLVPNLHHLSISVPEESTDVYELEFFVEISMDMAVSGSGFNNYSSSVSLTVVPEPGDTAMGIGLIGFFVLLARIYRCRSKCH